MQLPLSSYRSTVLRTVLAGVVDPHCFHGFNAGPGCGSGSCQTRPSQRVEFLNKKYTSCPLGFGSGRANSMRDPCGSGYTTLVSLDPSPPCIIHEGCLTWEPPWQGRCREGSGLDGPDPRDRRSRTPHPRLRILFSIYSRRVHCKPGLGD